MKVITQPAQDFPIPVMITEVVEARARYKNHFGGESVDHLAAFLVDGFVNSRVNQFFNVGLINNVTF
jgi:hypothetical protein